MVSVGSILEGKVVSVMPFGAFVDIGNKQSGLVHISELSSRYVKDINDCVKKGDTVKVKVIKIDESGKISLSMKQAEEKNQMTVRLHTGDPSLYGAIREQMDQLDKDNIPYDVVPGVSSFCGAAAALKAEYTLPNVSQSVIITRMAGKTPVPEKEEIALLAAHQATMVIFLSTGMLEQLSQRLLAGGYQTDTPAAIVYKATWDDEKVCHCTVATLAQTAKEHNITKTALIIVGNCLGNEYDRSLLYHPSFTHEFRKGTSES